MTAFAGMRHDTLNFVADDAVVARYTQNRSLAGVGVGVNLSPVSDVRFGVSFGRLKATVDAGNPGLPELSGGEARSRLGWRYDGQDSPVVPSLGLRSLVHLDHVFKSPALPPEFPAGRTSDGITQAEVTASQFWSLDRRDRLFVAGGAGTTWGDPLATEQFQMGGPFRLGALDSGALRGDHYAVVSLGFLRGIGRLPDLLGGPFFVGGWLETGSAFDSWETAPVHTNLNVGTIADTLVGPTLLGASFDLRGGWRYYVGVGRLF
jgi:outer membrane protein assembly factor BamA